MIGCNSNPSLAGNIASYLSLTGTGDVRIKAEITHEMRFEGAMLAFTSKSGYPTFEGGLLGCIAAVRPRYGQASLGELRRPSLASSFDGAGVPNQRSLVGPPNG